MASPSPRDKRIEEERQKRIQATRAAVRSSGCSENGHKPRTKISG